MSFDKDPATNREYIQFDYGKFHIKEITNLTVTGFFSLNTQESFHFGIPMTDFKVYNLTNPANWLRETSTAQNLIPYKGLISLGPNFSWSKIKQKNLSTQYPHFSSFLLNHKTNENSGKFHLSTAQKKQDLKIMANFFAYYLKRSPLQSEIQNYTLITVIPPKPKYSWNNSDVIAEEFVKVFKIPFVRLLKRLDDQEKHFALLDNIFQNNNLSTSKILLVDDIVTTGNTKRIVSNILKSFHCPHIFVLTLGYSLLEKDFPLYL